MFSQSLCEKEQFCSKTNNCNLSKLNLIMKYFCFNREIMMVLSITPQTTLWEISPLQHLNTNGENNSHNYLELGTSTCLLYLETFLWQQWNVNQNTSSLKNQTIPIGWHITCPFKATKKPIVKNWLEDQMYG